MSLTELPLIADLTNVDCLLATLPAPSLDENGLRIQDGEIPFLIQNLSTSFANLGMNVSCIECSSPGFSELTERLSTQVGRESASDFVDGAVDFLTELLGGDFITLELDRLVANARMKCPHRPEYEPGAASRAFEPFDPIERDTSIQFLIALAVAVGCGILAVAIFLGTIRVVVRRRHRKWLDSLTDQRVLLLWQHQQNEKARNEKLNAATKSLFQSADIPLFARLVIPLIIIGNIGLFLSGHLSPAASVNASVTVAGDTYTETDFFEFSLASGTVNLWNAGGRELAILIFVFSGVWPYAKQLISLVLWFLPPSRVSFSRRENIYLWLDFLAKWSMVDVITIVITLVAFRVTIQR